MQVISVKTIQEPPKGAMFSSVRYTVDGQYLELSLPGTVTMPPVLQTKYGKRYCIGVEFDEDKLHILDKILEKIKEKAVGYEMGNPPHKAGGVVYFKLPFSEEDQKFLVDSNTPLEVATLPCGINRGMSVKVTCSPNAWVKVDGDTKSFGLTLKPTAFVFGEEKTKKRKKVSIEEGADIAVKLPVKVKEEPAPKKLMSSLDRKILKALNTK
jgi:hypothetical protein